MPKSTPEIDPPDERWGPPQVAVFMKLSAQTARNRMMQGRFGASEYDPKTRKLTVSKRAVLLAREKSHRKKSRR